MAPIRVQGQGGLGGGEQAGALAGAERVGRAGQGGAGLHLDEGHEPGLFGDEVELAGGGAEPPGQDGPAVAFECRRNGRLGVEAQALRRGTPAPGGGGRSTPAFLHRVARDEHALGLGIARSLQAAPIVRQRAARVKGAARRRRDRARHLAAHRGALPPGHREVRDRVQQQARVRDGAARENTLSPGPISTMRPKIHDTELVRHVSHDREIVADEQVGQLQPLLQTRAGG